MTHSPQCERMPRKLSRQCRMLLNRLRSGPATSWQLQQLGVCSHTSRISELRKARHVIEKSEKWTGHRRIVTYYLVASHNGDLPTDTATRSYTHIDAKLRCAECNRVIERKAKARPLKSGELPFCKNSCRNTYHNRRKAIQRTEAQQSLDFQQERLRSERKQIT